MLYISYISTFRKVVISAGKFPHHLIAPNRFLPTANTFWNSFETFHNWRAIVCVQLTFFSILIFVFYCSLYNLQLYLSCCSFVTNYTTLIAATGKRSEQVYKRKVIVNFRFKIKMSASSYVHKWNPLDYANRSFSSERDSRCKPVLGLQNSLPWIFSIQWPRPSVGQFRKQQL